MGKIYEQRIATFSGGMANDIRETDLSKFAYTKGFDTFSYKHRLVPYRSYEAGNSVLNQKINKFLYAGGKLWGRGFISGTPTVYDAAVYYKNTFTDGVWTVPANNSFAGSVSLANRATGDLFVYYNGFIYGANDISNVFKFDVTEAAAFDPSNFTKFSIGVGVVHSKDNILYVSSKAANNGNALIHKNNDGTWTDTVLSLPKNLTVTSMCEYGNYLAIACASDDPLAKSSKVFLWDRDSSVATLSESIDWGEGSLNVLEELDGRLIGISIQQRVVATNLLFNTTISFKYYAGAQGAVEFARMSGKAGSDQTQISHLGTQKQKANNRLYFTAIITTPESNVTREGVWSVGRNERGGYSIMNEYQSSDGTIPSAIDGFFLMGSYIFIAYSNSDSFSGNVSKSDDTDTYSNNSVYESLVFDGSDSSLKKKLIGVTVNTVPLPTAGSVVLKYRIDENILGGAWTTIFTNTTVNSLSHSAVNIESTGATLPEFNEVQFQIISTGGAAITGLSCAYEITGKRIY